MKKLEPEERQRRIHIAETIRAQACQTLGIDPQQLMRKPDLSRRVSRKPELVTARRIIALACRQHGISITMIAPICGYSHHSMASVAIQRASPEEAAIASAIKIEQ